MYGDSEVKLTGRVAQREVRRTRRTPQSFVELVEITPTDLTNGSWKKWVNFGELFKITVTEDE